MLWKSDSMTLPVSDGKGSVHAVAPLATLAFMAWPTSPRDAFMTAEAWRKDLTISVEGCIPDDILAEIEEANWDQSHPQLERLRETHFEISDFVRLRLDRIKDRSAGGSLAGQTLLHRLVLAEHYSEHSSVNKAQFLVHRSFMRDSTTGPTGMRALKSYWIEFQPAVHLWAAFVHFPRLLSDDIHQFLLIADEIARLSEQQGVQFSARLWRLPDDIRSKQKIALGIPKLTEAGEKALLDYRAPSSPTA